VLRSGIIVGCDSNQQWLLPWWWKHYSAHNSYPVAFVDFGMTQNGRSWCKEKGEYILLPPLDPLFSSMKPIPPSIKESWELRYGKKYWSSRCAWLKKPFALFQSPFDCGIWIDLDCQVKGTLEPIFHCLGFGTEFALSRDAEQHRPLLLPGEVHYNSGVIAFRKRTKILQQWREAIVAFKDLLPGDQEILSRAIFLHKPAVLELPFIYNWPKTFGANEHSIIDHFFGGQGKLDILHSIGVDAFCQNL